MSSNFRTQQLLLITPQAGVFANRTFKSLVMEKKTDRLHISIPYHKGKMVLLPRGIPVKVEIPLKTVFFSEIGNKCAGGDSPFLELVLPYQIIKKERIKAPRIITVTSGKGGAGKTTLLINLAVKLSQQGFRVCIVDCDLGTSNIDVLLNLHARHTIQDVIEGRKNIFEILIEGPNNIVVVPGSSGFKPLTRILESQAQKVINSLGALEPYIDIILIDTGPGVSDNVMFFNRLADEIIMLTTTEPHSITDCYATLKVLMDKEPIPVLGLVVNKAEDKKEADSVAERIVSAAKRFLSLDIIYLGHVVDDIHVSKSIKRLCPCLLKFPNCNASWCYQRIAAKVCEIKQNSQPAPPLERIKRILPFP